jgi:hypothetical protein
MLDGDSQFVFAAEDRDVRSRPKNHRMDAFNTYSSVFHDKNGEVERIDGGDASFGSTQSMSVDICCRRPTSAVFMITHDAGVTSGLATTTTPPSSLEPRTINARCGGQSSGFPRGIFSVFYGPYRGRDITTNKS